MLSKLYYEIDKVAHYLFSCMFSKRAYKHYRQMYKDNGIVVQPLTRAEKQEIKRRWKLKRAFVGVYDTHKLYKSITGKFDVEICSEQLFRTKIEPQLIDKKCRDAWDDKNLFSKYLPNVPFPKTVVRNMYGTFFDKDYNVTDFNEAYDIVKDKLPVIIKPSIASGQSRGIKKIKTIDELDKAFTEYKSNYIIQEIIKPCEELRKLSINAVPIIRMITFCIDGKPEFVSATLRTNTLKDAVSDNYITPDGMGMLTIGVDENGRLGNIGRYSSGIAVEKMPNGFDFCGVKIPKFNELKDIVLSAQKQMPMFKCVGWDVTLDENYNPVVIEYNLKGMGIYYYQLANGPLFGKHTDNVIKKYL